MKGRIVVGCMVIGWVLVSPGAFAEDQLHHMLPSFVKKYPDEHRLEKVSGDFEKNLVIYTRDAPADVRSFYRKTMGKEPDEKGRFCIVRLVGPGVDDNFWVRVQEKSARKRFFNEGLDDEIMLTQDSTARTELQALRKRYDYLASGWYPDFDPKKKMKSCVSAKRFQNERGVQANRAGQEDMARQIQQLIAQGKFQEAAALGRGGMRSSMKQHAGTMKAHQAEDKAAVWRSCLEDVAKHRYRTMVWIDLVPQEFYDRFRHEPCN